MAKSWTAFDLHPVIRRFVSVVLAVASPFGRYAKLEWIQRQLFVSLRQHKDAKGNPFTARMSWNLRTNVQKKKN
jgi:hypothetical protein